MENNFENKLSSMSASKSPASLYVVATPIGNIADISQRAIEILQKVDAILVEDTRHSGQLLSKINIKKPLIPLHEHNERSAAKPLIERIKKGESMALISDAGTPLISDPGFNLVREAQAQEVKVIPIPGPSALITALSASGLPTDKFIFQGFLPSKKNERQKSLQSLALETRTLIFYEAPHRIVETLEDMIQILGSSREAVIARELTKTFETIRRLPLEELLKWVVETDQTRGEIVLLVAGNKISDTTMIDAEATRILNILLAEMSITLAASMTAKITGFAKRDLYQLALKLKEDDLNDEGKN